MAHPYHHALSSARSFHSTWEEHFPLHSFLDSSKRIFADPRHRALFHHICAGEICHQIFPHIPNAREIAHQHVEEDMGYIPNIKDWLPQLPDKIRESFLKTPMLHQRNIGERLLPLSPFPKSATPGLEACLDLLLVPEKTAPELEDSPLRIFYFTAAGPFLCETALGPLLSDGHTVTRYAAEWLIRHPLGYIPSFQDLMAEVTIEDWMFQKARNLAPPNPA